MLKEKWLSVTKHIASRYSFPIASNTRNVIMGSLTRSNTAQEIWLKPGSASNNELFKVVHSTRLLNILPHLTECVNTTALESYHSLYLTISSKQYTPHSQSHGEKEQSLLLLTIITNIGRKRVCFLIFITCSNKIAPYNCF